MQADTSHARSVGFFSAALPPRLESETVSPAAEFSNTFEMDLLGAGS